MKKIILFIAILGLNFAAKAQTEHVDGQTKLVNPAGRTLIIEKDDDDSWLTFHDPGQHWYSMGIDKSNSGSFSLNSGGSLNSSQFVMSSNGNIGIGTPSPNGKLDIRLGGWNNFPRVTFNQTSDHPSIRLYRPTGSAETAYPWWIENNKNLSFKSSSPANVGSETVSDIMTLSRNGNVAIYGKLEAKEIKVTLTPTADFVFEEDYNLPTLASIEEHIKKKKHLPEIASAKKMKKNGVNIGEFQIQLLQKIEELTLYTISQEKKISNLEKENEVLKSLTSDLASLKADIEKLKNKE